MTRVFSAELGSGELTWTLGSGLVTASAASRLCCESGSCASCASRNIATPKTNAFSQAQTIATLRSAYAPAALKLLKTTKRRSDFKKLAKVAGELSAALRSLLNEIQAAPAEYLVCPLSGCQDPSVVGKFESIRSISTTLRKNVLRELKLVTSALKKTRSVRASQLIARIPKLQVKIKKAQSALDLSVSEATVLVADCQR